jgi:3'-phosphoadenosine 5'-phosphosulfate sulfotransferase (PAPS reductase)/FAD synthetase
VRAAAWTTLLRAHLAGRRVVASVSGGKDSAAMSLHLTELGIEHDRVFADTGWEHPRTYDYLRGELTRVLGPIVEVRGPRGMADLIRWKGMFPSRKHRFCTSEAGPRRRGGGKRLELFIEPHDGCARWGLCEPTDRGEP